MKIGAVCEQTGLTDRTVRYYIDEELLSPNFTKNYLGRKTFDFTDDDVRMLRDVAILRKYGFSIPEIRAILKDPQQRVTIIEALQKKKKDIVRKEQALLDVLLTLEQGRAYTVPQLAEVLDCPKLNDTELPEEPIEGCLMGVCKLLFWITCGPVALFIIVGLPLQLWDWSATFLYVKYYPWFDTWVFSMVGLVIPIVAAAAMISLDSRRGRMDPVCRQFLIIILLICYLLFGAMGTFYSALVSAMPAIYSETEDPEDYMVLGTYETERMGRKLSLLFPENIPEYALGEAGQLCPDSTRYYNYVDIQWDGRFELFAQWKYRPEDLEAEKLRIRDALSEYELTSGHVGDWTVLSYSYSDPLMLLQYPDTDEEQWCRYSYLFVAWHEESGMVRYIASYSEYEKDTPAFLSLDWE